MSDNDIALFYSSMFKVSQTEFKPKFPSGFSHIIYEIISPKTKPAYLMMRASECWSLNKQEFKQFQNTIAENLFPIMAINPFYTGRHQFNSRCNFWRHLGAGDWNRGPKRQYVTTKPKSALCPSHAYAPRGEWCFTQTHIVTPKYDVHIFFQAIYKYLKDEVANHRKLSAWESADFHTRLF